MKRLIPAAIILIFTLATCFYSHFAVSRACAQTLKDIDSFSNNSISAEQLEKSWQKQKEKMSIFVNHELLDAISIHVGQLTATEEINALNLTIKNIETDLFMIKEEQTLSINSFY